MPKVKKLKAPALESLNIRHEPLGQVIEGDSLRGKYAPSISGRRQRRKEDQTRRRGAEVGGDDDGFLDEKSSQRIIEMSRTQQIEEEIHEQRVSWNQTHKENKRHQQHSTSPDDHDDNDDSEEDEESIEELNSDDDDDDYIENDEGYVNVRDGTLGLSAEDEAIVAAMNSGGGAEERKTLADIIMQKIAEKECKDQGGEMLDDDNHDEHGLSSLPQKVVEVYTDIGKILNRYTSGKLPKAFKVIPSLSNWEDVLYLTRPDLWTPHAMYAATRIFASNLNPKMAQRFYYLVLLDAVRADIYESKRLNYHYYISLKKAVYKPAAFFKGILLPLCKEDCTLREAAIVASVLQRVSIPVHHSAVAIHKLAQMKEYNGAASIFIKTLLNKKYALPVPVIASLVRHFASFINDDRDLPVLWHQALLTFCQRYKNEIQDQQARESLRLVMKKHFHHKITPEIRRELFGVTAWKNERSVAAATSGDKMII